MINFADDKKKGDNLSSEENRGSNDNVSSVENENKDTENLNTEVEKETETKTETVVTEEVTESNDEESKLNGLLDEMKFLKSRIRYLEDENKKFKNESEAFKTRLQNISSEYENYRNRTDKEKAELADSCTVKVLKDIVPIIDNLERALVAETDDLEGLKAGVNLTLTQFFGTFEKMGIEEISTEDGFNPELHEAVMHENNPEVGPNQVGEVFLKGYKKGDKVIRHSVVKVIN